MCMLQQLTVRRDLPNSARAYLLSSESLPPAEPFLAGFPFQRLHEAGYNGLHTTPVDSLMEIHLPRLEQLCQRQMRQASA